MDLLNDDNYTNNTNISITNNNLASTDNINRTDNLASTDNYNYKSISYINKCIYCINDESSHSFSIHKNTNIAALYSVNSDNIIMFNTMICEAKMYNSPATIIYHIEQELDYNKPDKNINWIWNIDFKNAELKHYFAFNTVKELSQWINAEKLGYCCNLKEIRIYNAGLLVKPLISLAYWFLPRNINVINAN